MSENKASIVAVLGASGSGKSEWVKRRLEKSKPRRLLVWDAMREYGDGTELTADIIIELAKHRAGPVKLVFHPASDGDQRVKQFSIFCAAALRAGNLTMLVEELRFVTTPSRAPLKWAEVCLTGRHRGLSVIGTSQRPASIDKDFLGNATLIHAGRLVYPEDVRAVSKAMQVDESRIAGLAPLEWVERDLQSGKVTVGKLTFTRA